MDFEEFNFDSILGEFMEPAPAEPTAPGKTDVTPPSEKTDAPRKPVPRRTSLSNADAPVPNKSAAPVSGEMRVRREAGKADEPSQKRMRQESDSNSVPEGKKTEHRAKDTERRMKDAERRTKEAERQAERQAKEAERQAEREEKEAEKKAERRRKVMEKKADQRRIEEQRLAAERERISTREYIERERSEKKKNDVEGRRRSRIGAIVSILILGILVGGVLAASRAVEESTRSMPNIYVGTIPVGNMTGEEIASRLSSGGWAARTQTPLTVSTLGGISFEVDPVQAGAVIPMDRAVNAAVSYGRDGNRFLQLYKYVESLLKPLDLNAAEAKINESYIQSCIEGGQQRLSEKIGTDPYTIDYDAGELRAVKGAGNLELEPVGLTSAIVSALKNGSASIDYSVISREPVMPDFAAIHTQIAAEVKDAKYSDDGKYNVIDETVGCDFDISEAVSIWTAAAPAQEAVIPLKVTRPNVTGDELRGRLFNDLLGTMTTYYTNSSDDRINNVNLAASKINGMIMYPGDLFSYNNTVGQRTEEAGFRYAAAYSDGEVVEELGGGACQVSSTLYCASLYARLETVDRVCHQFEVAYMDQLGLDATVSWPDPDFKFRNNKTYPIKLVAYCDNDARSLTFEIWGTAEDDYTVELKTDKYQHVNDEGNWIGWRTVTYRVLYDSDGNVVQVPDPDGNMVGYEYTYTNEEGKPLMDTYLFH